LEVRRDPGEQRGLWREHAVCNEEEAFEEVGVELEIAGLGGGALARPHAAHGEGAGDEFVAEHDRVAGAVAEERHNHVAGDAQFVGVLSAEEASEAAGQAAVGHLACQGGGGAPSRCRARTESTMLFRVEREAPIAVKSQSMARRVSRIMGRRWPGTPRPTAQVRQERQLRQALRRVERAVPKGAIMVVKAWVMAPMVVGVWRAKRASTGP
jgi:hypothetical protein